MNRTSQHMIAALLLWTGAPAFSAETVSVDLTGVQIKDKTNQSRSSAPDQLDAGFAYEYDISGKIVGKSGLLKDFFPDPIDLAELLEGFEEGSSEMLKGLIYNPTGQHPYELTSQTVSGEYDFGFLTVTFEATISAGLNSNGEAYFKLEDVTISPARIVGYVEFTEGIVVVRTIPILLGDMNRDGDLNFDDIDPFVLGLVDPATYIATYGIDPIFAGDCNRDGVLDFGDIDAFVAELSK